MLTLQVSTYCLLVLHNNYYGSSSSHQVAAILLCPLHSPDGAVHEMLVFSKPFWKYGGWATSELTGPGVGKGGRTNIGVGATVNKKDTSLRKDQIGQ